MVSSFGGGSVWQAAEKAGFQAEIPKGFPQGLKPSHFLGVCGTTEVVPFQGNEFFRGL